MQILTLVKNWKIKKFSKIFLFRNLKLFLSQLNFIKNTFSMQYGSFFTRQKETSITKINMKLSYLYPLLDNTVS